MTNYTLFTVTTDIQVHFCDLNLLSNVDQMKTRTGYSDSIFQKELTYQFIANKDSIVLTHSSPRDREKR